LKAAKARGANDTDIAAALASAREQQAATREVLEAMSASGFDLKKVLQTIAENAVRLCKADNASVILRDAVTAFETLGSAGHFEIGFAEYERYYAGRTFQPGKGSLTGRVLLARKTVQIEDMSTDPDYDPSSAPTMIPQTLLGVPIMRDGDVAGLIIVRRYHVALFNAREIEILETFSQQAAIAVENVRLFNETKEALERQTALSEILGAMSASPTETQPVFEAIARNAARYCDAEDALIALVRGSKLRIEAHHGPVAVYTEHYEWQLDRSTVSGRSIVDGVVVQVEDLQAADADFSLGGTQARELGYRTVLAAPLLRQGRSIGTLCLRRLQVRSFAPRQVELLRAFATQAAIAIENVRLFNETKQALEQQTAVADVLQSMSRSAFDLQAVFDVVVENATKLCRGDWGYLFRK
jgi:GAF domain-containing protein